MKETYISPLLEMTEFSALDVITTSFQYDNNETEMHKNSDS